MSSTPPTTLGKYQIIREIARSNDIVYEAYDPLMNRRVALKELALPSGSTPQQKDDRLKRFLREAKAAGSLAHPNIVTIFEVGEQGGRHYLVMEYLDGHTLRNEIDTKGFLSVSRSVEVAESLLRALEYAHQNGVIHRDIKPENIQLLSDGRIKLTDFGIARLTFEPNLTMDGQVFGTPSYMSPEQVVGREIDVRSDLFSVGVVLYEMLSGSKPFRGDSVVTITYAIMNTEPEQIRQAPHAIQQVLNKVLDKSPTLRYGSASEMLRALDDARRSLTSGTPQPPTQMGVQAPMGVPQGGAPPIITAPYGQQQSPTPGQPITAPYGQSAFSPHPAPAQVPGPPMAYPYNPYNPAPIQQQPPGLGGPIHTPYQPGATHPQQQIPISSLPMQVYYPPPPRKPLLEPDQKVFLSRLFLAIFLSITVFGALAFWLIKVYGNPAQNQLRFEPNTVSQPVNDSAVPPNEEPSEDFSSTDAAMRGDQQINQAAGTTDFGEQVAKLETAASWYDKAYEREAPSEQRDQWGNQAALIRLEIARKLSRLDRTAARQQLYTARRHASDDSLRNEIEHELLMLS